MAVTIQVRVDDELKAKSDELFKELGTDTTTAIRIFLTQAISQNGFPFEIKRHTYNPFGALSEDAVMGKLASSRRQADEGKVRTAGKVSEDLRAKYDL